MRDFNHTVNVLVKAYLNDTLVHGNCYACAVGNIVAESKGYNYVKCTDEPFRKVVWDIAKGSYDSFVPMWFTYLDEAQKPADVRDQVQATGYTWDEIRRIEKAFECCERPLSGEQWMFNGLMAVVDVLAEIHNVDLSVKESAKLQFVKP